MRCLLAASALGLTLLPGQAGAQIVGQRNYGPVSETTPFLPDSRLPGPSIRADVRNIRERIADARESGALSRREARRMDREARRIGYAASRYGRDGLSASERRELQARAEALRSTVGRAPRG